MNNKKILVVGDVMLDVYSYCVSPRISPEGPIVVGKFSHEEIYPGGAANVAANIKALGGDVRLVSLVGQDQRGKQLLDCLTKLGIDYHIPQIAGLTTTVKQRFLVNGSQIFRQDFEDLKLAEDFSKRHCRDLFTAVFRDAIKDIDVPVLVYSDYDKWLLPNDYMLSSLYDVLSDKTADEPFIICDTKKCTWDALSCVNTIKINQKEFEAAAAIIHGRIASGHHSTPDKSKLATCVSLCKYYCLSSLVITDGENGLDLYRYESDRLIHQDAYRVGQVCDVTGAGDTVLAALAVSISEGKSLEKSLPFTAAAAGVVVSKKGTSTASRYEVDRILSAKNQQIFTDDELSRVEALVSSARQAGKKVVFTNGCFDLLHPGHVTLLNYAKTYGDLLIVGMNSDASVRILKGENRPICNENDRSDMLACLSCVDMVVIFDDTTPLKLIEAIQPDVLVKGADYKDKQIVGAELVKARGGKVAFCPLVKDYSTTKIIEKHAFKKQESTNYPCQPACNSFEQ